MTYDNSEIEESISVTEKNNVRIDKRGYNRRSNRNKRSPILKQPMITAELQHAGKSKDSANKTPLQKLENVTDDLEKAQQELKELKEKQNEKNNTKNTKSFGIKLQMDCSSIQ